MAVRKFLSAELVKGAGPIAACRFTPGASQAAIVVSEQWGVTSITRDNTGLYTIAIAGKPKGVCAVVAVQENDATHWHVGRVESQSDSAGTVTISHKSVAYASVASGPSLSDTVDGLVVLIYGRAE